FARSVLSAVPAPNLPGTANNYSIADDFTNDSDKAAGKIDVHVSPALSLFGRYGWRDLSTFDQPPIPLGWSNTQGGKNPPGLGTGGTPTLTGLPTDARVAGGLLSENISGYTSST